MRGSGTWKGVANAQWLGNLLLGATLLGIWSLHGGVGDLRSAYNEQTALMLGRLEERMLSTTWVSDGQTYTVETPCRAEEDPAVCWEVHDARVAAGQALHPPN